MCKRAVGKVDKKCTRDTTEGIYEMSEKPEGLREDYDRFRSGVQ